MVKFIKMQQSDYERYLTITIPNYAEEKVKAGNYSPDRDPLKLAKEEFDQLLPQGLETEQQYLNTLLNENGENIGIIWFMKKLESTTAFICDFMIWPEYRGRGYGAEALQALEEEVKHYGVEKITLHVFGHNTNAIGLYKKCGYDVTNMHMAKIL